jgi:hypothetical protein
MGLASHRMKPGQMASESTDKSNRATLLPRTAIDSMGSPSVLDTVSANKAFQHDGEAL